MKKKNLKGNSPKINQMLNHLTDTRGMKQTGLLAQFHQEV